ncbi:hypothetical protein PENSPDRAFT_689112 [Peniophora sp. CONT]|nr:hypothetical protein PENSPDRAFT_689112 [Peniophora sp. CONT]
MAADHEPSPSAWAFLHNMLNFSGEKHQHWTLAQTPYERKHDTDLLSHSDISSYFPAIIHQTGPIRLDRDTCRSLVSHDRIAAFSFWQQLYRAHAPHAIDYPLWNWTMELLSDWDHSMEKSLPRLIKAGLFEFFEEVICREEFFYDFPALLLNIFEAIKHTFLSLMANDYPNLKRDDPGIKGGVDRLTAMVCRVSWEHRARLLVEQDVLDDRAGQLKQARAALHRLVITYYNFHHPADPEHLDPQIDYSAFRHTDYEHIRRVTFFLWFHYDDTLLIRNESDVERARAGILTYAIKSLNGCAADDPEPAAFASDILHEYGAVPVLSRLDSTLRGSKMDGTQLFRVQMLVQLLFLRTEYFPHFASSGVLGALREAVDRCECDSEIPVMHGSLLITALDIYGAISTYAATNDGRAPLIRQYDAIGLLSRCILVSAELDFPFPERCYQHIYEYTTFARALCERHGKKNVLRQALTKSVRWHWYHTLKGLREMEKAEPDVVKGRILLEKAWLSFGDVLGLDEGQEEAEYYRTVKGASQFCAWKECPYHTSRPFAPLSTCKGCGQAYYCGKACQVRDWKEGHKQACKRIKDEAYAAKK